MKKVDIKRIFPSFKRNTDSNKYDYGHILVVAGSKNMPGAGVLCCNAAMRAGAGLVTYAVRSNFLATASAMSNPETMFFVYKSAEEIIKFIKARKVLALVIGPGLEKSEDIRKLIKKIINSVSIPVILDASGIAVFNNKLSDLKKTKARLIVTPHEGEFAKLTNQNIKLIKTFKEKVASKFAKDNSLFCVLKGNKTIVSDGTLIYKNSSATPALATAGSGDVLSGIIAAFVSVNNNFFEALKFAVYIHGIAGKLAEKDKGMSGVIASDIIENVSYAMKDIFESLEV